jgi:hypothetical protein
MAAAGVGQFGEQAQGVVDSGPMPSACPVEPSSLWRLPSDADVTCPGLEIGSRR